MNLQTEITEVRARLGEPFRVQDENSFILDREITNWIQQGELRVLQDFPIDALLSLQTEQQIDTVDGQEEYSLASDFVRLIDVRVNYGQGWFKARLVESGDLSIADVSPGFGFSHTLPLVAFSQGKLALRPVPDTVTAGMGRLKVRYLKEPTRRYKHHTGFSTGGGSTTTLVDSACPGPNSYWNGTTLRFLTNDYTGTEVTVTGFTSATGTIAFAALTSAPGTGVQYDMGTESDLPGEFWEAWVAYAAFRALSKDRETDLAAMQMQDYKEIVAHVRERFETAHKSEPMKEA